MSAVSRTPNKELMSQARASLQGKWTTPVLVTLGLFIVTGIAGIVPFLSLLISGSISLSMAYFFLTLVREGEVDTSQINKGLTYFVPALLTYLLMLLFIFLWLLLLIIPGLMAAYSYAMTFYVLSDQPELGPRAALDRSKELMQGNRWKLVGLSFRFFGWGILAILTCGIGFLWLLPYFNASCAHFYEDLLRNEAEETQLLVEA